MSNDFLITIFFGTTAVLIMFGVFFQTKSILDQGLGIVKIGKFWAISMKYVGFAILAYLVYECPAEKLIFNLAVFVASYFVSFLLYLLARRVSLR
ncbi:hypothetical protein [Silvanigrella aquatica]|uniref:Uncharacterized protein n=1 Tax=Silvanigrella aquatica TaxID=1915309 RepID=A0A1L4D4C0_9BACT|nr:hypothetical protein [Silvanigrella aquatica]APJ05017.1 hypothetical protein AXG55_14400 [Silvanigrella aquatica]